MRYLTLEPGTQILLPSPLGPQAHVFEAEAILAVNAALAARRPLLVRGEPGTGKSQLALAAAYVLRRPFLAKVVDARTEAQDLFWSFDSVERLGQAQVLGAMGSVDPKAVTQLLAEANFLAPGPLWWAFDWNGAAAQAQHTGANVPSMPSGWAPGQGVVVLLDEIDKADTAVPNGLLEALGSGRLPGYGKSGAIVQTGEAPLVVVTTNEERSLPDAFLRRCLVLHLALPESTEALHTYLVDRGRAHFPEVDQDILARAAELLVADRRHWQEQGLSAPGQAEYLDLLRAVVEQTGEVKAQRELLEKLARFTYQKHPREVE